MFQDHVSTDIIKKRCELLRELSEQKKKEFMGSFVGKEVSVLVEGNRDKVSGLTKATARNSLQLHVRCDTAMRNQEIKVVVADNEGRAIISQS